MAKKPKWTFMVYFAADNNLSDLGKKNLQKMQTVGSTPEVSILAEFDYSGDRKTKRYKIGRNTLDELASQPEKDETDFGDPETLKNFVSDVIDEFQADRYALVLWGHGTGWDRWDMERIDGGKGLKIGKRQEAGKGVEPPYHRLLSSRDRRRRNKFFTPRPKVIGTDTISERPKAIGTDTTSEQALDTIDLGEVLSFVNQKIGRKLDLFGMNACWMSSFEVMYQIHKHVEYVVSSEFAEPPPGWPYDAILGRLVQNPELSTTDFARYIVNSKLKYYKNIGYKAMPVTLSALDLSKIDAVSNAVDHLADELIGYMPNGFDELDNAINKSTHFNKNTQWDIGHFCKNLMVTTKSGKVKAAAEDVGSALGIDLNKFVVENSNKFVVENSNYEEGTNRFCGVSISLVPTYKDISEYYYKLEWNKSCWLRMIETYRQSTGQRGKKQRFI